MKLRVASRVLAGTVVFAGAFAVFAFRACCSGCSPTRERVMAEAGLDPSVPYLRALRRAAEANHPEAAQQWLLDRDAYQAFRSRRLEELRHHPYLLRFPAWSDEQRLGWDTWFHWTAGNQLLWRDLAQRSGGALNLLRLLDNRALPREQRFARFGLINDPDTGPPTRDSEGHCLPDAYGLCLDRVLEPRESEASAAFMGRASGILGLRLFANPDYQSAAWNPAEPWQPPAGCTPGAREGSDASTTARESNQDCLQPPLVVGMTCGFCHITFDPENPPADVANPGWQNLAGTLGNIYLREGPLFAWMLDFGEDNFYTHYLRAQQPGTSDTSRIATDDLDNPSAINGIFHLGSRLAEASTETLPHGGTGAVPHVLKDGADSAGVPLAALRVYVNIGMLGNEWLNDHDAYLLLGGQPTAQKPFRIAHAMVTPSYDGTFAWNRTEARMADLQAYLEGERTFPLADAPGGEAYLEATAASLDTGRRVFADHCAGCHSSKQPAFDRRASPERWRDAMRALVASDDFLRGNFLSDDRRYPAQVVGVNLARSMATNALQGQVWNDLSSLTYKGLPSIGEVTLTSPFAAGETLSFCPPAGGRGYYRTASLVSLWATAPFFHNNAVGRPVHDPSVAGRLAAFDDAVEQLLWPERRTDPSGRPGPYIKRTGDRVTWLELPSGLLVPVPPRYPIKMVGNLPLHSLAEKLPSRLLARLTQDVSASRQERKARIVDEVLGNETLRKLLRKMLLRANSAPDFVENKGHEAIVARIDSDADKHALAAFLARL